MHALGELHSVWEALQVSSLHALLAQYPVQHPVVIGRHDLCGFPEALVRFVGADDGPRFLLQDLETLRGPDVRRAGAAPAAGVQKENAASVVQFGFMAGGHLHYGGMEPLAKLVVDGDDGDQLDDGGARWRGGSGGQGSPAVRRVGWTTHGSIVATASAGE